ncbi:MAG: sigma-70 family RNA polymerase sigma factor [Limisphaerales bacterium]
MIAVSPTNERATCRLVENSSVGCRQTFLDVHRSSEICFNPEEWKTPSEDELAPAEHARNDEATNRWDADTETDARVASRKESSKERSETIITLYLREIGRVKLLTRQEEIELAARIRQGDREARDQMIKANLRLVVKIARSYEGMGMPLLDLISEGNIGLMRAVERFDPGKGAKLSSYSVLWIKHAIIQAFASQSKATRVPMHVMEKLGKMRRVSLRLQEELGREPTDEELAAELGTTASQVARMRMAVVHPVSLDAEMDGDGSRSYAEVIADERAETPCQKLENETNRAMVRKIVDTLTRREQAVLYSRFGLNGNDPKNLEEVGKELNITDERVRQIQNAAFVKLRRRLKNFERGLICEGGGNGNIK